MTISGLNPLIRRKLEHLEFIPGARGSWAPMSSIAESFALFRPWAKKQVLASEADDALVALTLKGASLAFDELVRRYQSPALQVAYKQLGDREVAKEVVQDAFMQLYTYLPRYEARGRFRSFFFHLLLNRCRMAVRKRKTRAEFEEKLRTFPLSEPRSPEETASQREEAQRAISELKEKQRNIVVLRFAGGLSYQEIAQTLDIPLGTVKSGLFSALERIRTFLVPPTLPKEKSDE